MSFFEVVPSKREKDLVNVIVGKGATVSYRYDGDSQTVAEVGIEVPAGAACDGVSNEKYVGKMRLKKARRSAERHFIEAKVKIQKGSTPAEAETNEIRARKADIVNKWLRSPLTPIDTNRASDKILRPYIVEFLEKNPRWTESVDELLALYRSVHAQRAADKRVQNEKKKADAELRREKAARKKSQKESQGDLFTL